ncbi:MAG: T9SS type A sorting domain-containing protein [Bacteroidales bacterium]|nr:T9SS type A sorting domain-containing protein [Bacteroidales bacterium]
MHKFTIKTTMLILLFCKISIVFSQEWQYKMSITEPIEYYRCFNIRELSDGNLISSANHYIRASTEEYWYSESPAVILLSKDGKELAHNNFFRPGYCTVSFGYTFEKDNYYYHLTTYSPEHFPGSFNHFENYDNPPSDAKLSLLKLDKELNLVESYDHSWPIDTYEDHGGSWEMYPNGFSGNIYLFTAFEEDDNIVGAYWKSVSFDNPSRGDDTLFFFRMNFDGEILLKKAVKVVEGKGNRYSEEKVIADSRGLRTHNFRGDHFVSTDYGYIFYLTGDGVPNSYQGAGRALYYDKDFNLLRTRYVKFNNPEYGETIGDFNVRRSNHNTTYLSSQMRSPDDPSHDEDCCLYELDDDIDAESNWLEIVNYIHRKTDEWDQPSFLSSVDLIDDNTLCYVYELYQGLNGDLDSYLVIEHLDNNLDTISTLYYGVDNGMTESVHDIERTKDGGVIIVNASSFLDNNEGYGFITKFPATAFGFEPDNIEEAHAHGLKLAVAYPNPGGDVMNIRTGLCNAILSVYDMQGRKIHEQEITDDITSIDASRWESGTYVWKLGIRNEELGMKCVESGKWVK